MYKGHKLVTGIGLTMLYVEPQEFLMGTAGPPIQPFFDWPPDRWQSMAGEKDEQQHRVKITRGYWLGETEVTQKQWRDVMGTEPWSVVQGPTGNNVAASCMDWNAAVEFCAKLTERERAGNRLPEGYRYALPTEAEWELACRAGHGTAFTFGDDPSEFHLYAICDQYRMDDYGAVREVKGDRKANDWGFYDMHGNVEEWCADLVDYDCGVVSRTYHDDAVDPLNASGQKRAVRGGCTTYRVRDCRSASREAHPPGYFGGGTGFRPALVTRSDK